MGQHQPPMTPPLFLPPQCTPDLIAWLERIQSDPLLHQAIEQESQHRFLDLLQGIKKYRTAHYQRKAELGVEVLRIGGMRLLRYSPPHGVTPHSSILLIPSLINRYYIMDLTESRSMVSYLSSQGVTCYLMDWGEPSTQDMHRTVAEYITGPLLQAFLYMHAEQPHASQYLLGHCMGGILATGLAQILPQNVLTGVVLMATPWDFSATAMQVTPAHEGITRILEQAISCTPTFAGDTMLALFYLRDPWLFQAKLRRFAKEKDDARIAHFLALEDWANDCVDVTSGVARDCLIHWGMHNQLMQRKWHIMDEPLDPSRLSCPVLLMIPRQDRIVPPASTAPLAEILPSCHIMRPDTGHVGMLVGAHAIPQCLNPMLAWMHSSQGEG